MNEIIIKNVVSKDWKVLQKLNSEVFISDSANDIDLNIEWPFTNDGVQYYKDLADRKIGNCVIAWSGNEPCGYVAMSIKDFGYRKSKYVEVDNMGVSPQFRSRGIGHLLIEAVKKWAVSQGATKLYVSAYFNNISGIKFYKREGFNEIGLELETGI